MPLPTTQQQYQAWLDAQAKYQKQQTGGASFLQALQSALAGADQQNTTLRQQQQALVQQQFEAPTKYREELISQGITDPYRRQALLNEKLGSVAANLTGVQGKLADLGGQRADVLRTAGGAYDAETAAALQQANEAGNFFKDLLNQEQALQTSQTKAEQQQELQKVKDEFAGRNDALKNLLIASQINRNNASANKLSVTIGGLIETPDTSQMAEDLLSGATSPSQLRSLYGTGIKGASAVQQAVTQAQKLAKDRGIQWSPAQSEINYQVALASGKQLGSRQTQTQLQIGNAMIKEGGHFDQLQKLTDTLKLSSSPLLQAVQIGGKWITGSQALKNFEALRNDLSRQVSQYFSGGNAPTDKSTELALEAIPHASPRQMSGILNTLRTAIEERLQAYQTPYITAPYPGGPNPGQVNAFNPNDARNKYGY